MSTPAETTASGYFGAMVESYDSLIKRAVPRYDEMTDRLIDYLPTSPKRILELGCGTGNLTLRLARQFPGAAITTVDAAPEMVDVTRERLTREHPASAARAKFVTAKFEELSLEVWSFDLITSCISLHHVADKATLYGAVHGWLADGGTFRFADQLRGGTEAIHAINWSRWIEFCKQPGHCTSEELQSLIDHAAAHDHYTPLHEHLKLLHAAGFATAKLDCVWRNWIWGIITADR